MRRSTKLLAFAGGLVLLLAASPAPRVVTEAITAQATTTSSHTLEVLCGTGWTLIPPLPGRKALELQNRGGVAIEVCLNDSSVCTIGKARSVAASGGTFAVDAADFEKVYCAVASGGAQTTGSGTIVSQVPRG